MSGIVGIFQRNGAPVTAETLHPAMEAIAHYASDDVRIWTDGTVGFGERLLHVTPESLNEMLPATYGNLTIVADARIDNRDALFAALAIPHSERVGMPDSVLIVRAYEKWGDDCPKYLVGDYAFAIWDVRTQTLFCARDHAGVKPLYYYAASDVFAFASDIRALIAFEEVETGVDEAEIAWHLLNGGMVFTNGANTFLKNVSRLLHGHSLRIDRQALTTTRYWLPSGRPAIRLPKVDDYANQLFELVQQAVSVRLRTEFPVGAHLSGGIDSGSVAVIAARLLRDQQRQLSTFSWSWPPDENIDQTEHARIEAIAQQEGLTPVYIDPSLVANDWADRIDISVTPFNAMPMEALVQRSAADRGIRLLLSGWGGDETVSFNGRGAPSEWLLHGHWRELERFLRLRDTLRHPRRLPASAQRLWRSVIVPLLPDALHTRFRLRQFYANNPTYIDPEFEARIRSQIRPFELPVRPLRDVHTTQYRLYENGYMTNRLESWAIFGAEKGITYAFPLLDRRVMEYIYAIPGGLHLRNGIDRYLYRYTMERVLPKGFAWSNVKDEPSIRQRGTNVLSRQFDPNSGWLQRLQQSNPWVDVDQLRQAIEQALDDGDAEKLLYVTRALDCIAIWQHWQARAKQTLRMKNI